jgi:pseudouridine synthase
MRLNKYLAQAGIGSRRACDRYIQEGRVAVNGGIQIQPAYQVEPTDVVTFDGSPVQPEDRLIYLQLYKPRGTLTTVRDPRGRETVMKWITDIKERIFPVGRLDYDSEGLLLFTNDGRITNILTHPRYEVLKTYRVYVSGQVNCRELEVLADGIVKNGRHYQAYSTKLIEYQKGFTIAEVVLNEGKKHEIRILFEGIGHPVLRLIRTKMGPITLDENLLPGEWRYLLKDEIKLLFERGGVSTDVNQ